MRKRVISLQKFKLGFRQKINLIFTSIFLIGMLCIGIIVIGMMKNKIEADTISVQTKSINLFSGQITQYLEELSMLLILLVKCRKYKI